MRRKPIRKRRISPNPRRNFFCGFFVFSELFTTSLQFCAEFFTYVWYDQGTTADKDAERLPQDGKDGRRFRRANGGKLVSAGLILPAEVSASAGFCFYGGLRSRVTPDTPCAPQTTWRGINELRGASLRMACAMAKSAPSALAVQGGRMKKCPCFLGKSIVFRART